MVALTAGSAWAHASRRSCLVLLLFLFVLCRAVAAFADEPISREYQLKATILYKFLGFIEWARDTNEGATSGAQEICILGTSPFGRSLSRVIELNRNDSRQVDIRELDRVEDAQHCTLLFIARSEALHLESILLAVRTTPTVTVSDIDSFAQRGGMIELVLEDRFVRFIINQDKAVESGVQFSSQLLALAKQLVIKSADAVTEKYIAPA